MTCCKKSFRRNLRLDETDRGITMTMPYTFTPQQVADAIRAGLPNRPDVVLSASEASDRANAYRNSLAHYREHVQKSLAEGDYLQAAEKSWGAYAQTIKAIAADHQLRLRSHTNILRVSERLVSLVSLRDPAAGVVLDNGANSAHSMHIHFYEDDLPAETVIRRADGVATAIALLQELFPPEPNSQ